jgi:tRNA (guanine37-N1)-methyltransferase
MKFHTITLFPESLQSALSFGVVGTALQKGLLLSQTTNPREFTSDVHHSVDDRPFGGGDGMIMTPEPLAQAIAQAKAALPKAKVYYMSAQGPAWSDLRARAMAKTSEAILVCGRYGGVDQRLLNTLVDEEICIGDYVLSGGELAAAVVIDSVARLIPGVLGHEDSAQKDSFAHGILEQPHFTRPADWQGQTVPAVLTSGNHKKIAEWQAQVAKLVTLKNRPDLFVKAGLGSERKQLAQFYSELSVEDKNALGLEQLMTEDYFSSKKTKPLPRVAVGLLHYPIVDREKRIVATNITNFDVHDIGRACTVYGIEKYYLIHPIDEQLMFVDRILDHWRTGQGAKFNPFRKRALEDVKAVRTLEAALADWGVPREQVIILATHARPVAGARSYSIQEIRDRIEASPEQRFFLLFGTGFGMTDEYMMSMDGVLESLRGAPPKDFRHLSVRSAVSIYLDRILGPW